ncbi:hypothetical protein MJO28_003787, partial [Puccinia striiformis f. sp. tritici]
MANTGPGMSGPHANPRVSHRGLLGSEEAYLEDIGRILAATLLEDLEREAGGATDGAGRTREEYGADVGPAAGSNVQPIE